MTTRPGIIITGGARRIGAALAQYFAKAGYDIALHYHHSKSEALEVKRNVEKLGAACALFSHDLSDIAAIPALMENIHAAMPQCAALINNASIFERGEFMETDEALFDRQFAVNFKAPFFLTQAFAKRFKKGAVIHMLDTDIAQTQGSHFAYLLSKKALTEFTLMAARALGPIRVNGICPGCILPSDQNDVNYMEKIRHVIPLKANPSVDAVAEAARWLIAQESITGQILYVDGGKHVL